MQESLAAFSTLTYAPQRSVSKSQEKLVIVGPRPSPLVSKTLVSNTNANENNSNKDYEGVQFVIVDIYFCQLTHIMICIMVVVVYSVWVY